MYDILKGLRIVEASAFVAAPLGGMTLAQLGADVIRFDPPGGGVDAGRWPVTREGKSLYWAGLNKGKRSLAVDAGREEGRALLTRLITAPGEGNGIFLTNLRADRGWMSYEALREHRDDLIMVTLLGSSDGTSAVDYTVNCAAGFPYVTGNHHADGPPRPVNHVFPAWDALAGMNIALAILAAERHRRLTGEGQLVKLALSDVAFAMTGNLGYIQEVQVNGEDRKGYGNYLYGAYGSEFRTADGRELYIVVVTDHMWKALRKATGLGEALDAIEARLGLDFSREGDRFRASAEISEPVRAWCAQRTLAEIETCFAATGVCWGPYRSFAQMVAEDPRVSAANPLFSEVEQPGIGSYLVPGSPISFGAFTRETPRPAPRLGEHSVEILRRDLAMSDSEIERLREDGVVVGPEALS
jgi:2-methylfumaryl-CoA isomerase